MTEQTLTTRMLIAMYRSASRGRLLTCARLAEHTGADEAAVRAQLQRLDTAGYVDADRLRLTLSGLAVAVALVKKQANSKKFARAA